jgi:hypothetical protein
VWIALPPRPGRYAYEIRLSTDTGAPLNRVRSRFFTVAPRGDSLVAREDGALFVLRVRTTGSRGTVASTPAGIDCGNACSAQFLQGTAVSLLATPAPRSAFKRWSGVCASGRACRLKVDRPIAVVAQFGAAPASRADIARGRMLTDRATKLMRAGNYAAALPVALEALNLLKGSGDDYEGYANYDVGKSLAELDRCEEALPYLERREQLLGQYPSVSAAKRKCRAHE